MHCAVGVVRRSRRHNHPVGRTPSGRSGAAPERVLRRTERSGLRCVTTERSNRSSTWWDDGGLPPVAGPGAVPGVFVIVRGWSRTVGAGRPPRCSHDPLLGLLAGRLACRGAKRRPGVLGRTVVGRLLYPTL